MACARRRGVFRVWGLLVLLPILGGEELQRSRFHKKYMFVLESLLRILFQNLLFCFRCSFHFAPRPVTKCLFRLRLRTERGCELRPWLRPAGESETCPGRQTAGRRLSSCCDLSERHRGLLRRPHHRPWKVINIEATHIWVRVKDCPSPVKIKNAEKLDVSDLLQKVKERSLL